MGLFEKHDAVSTTNTGIHIESVRNEIPDFRRVYTAKVDNRCSIKITIRTFMGQRYSDGELTQPNGKWIIFETNAIADKIIDPTLVPLVQRYTDEILELDKAFMRTNPSEFTDERGVKWKRVE